ncbi:hypothetical protein XELAEV_18015275mg [Xenopus laevis]|uniref:TGF-beta family profile domain-containing protein n=1 Tax=Xenopus laevis TaxID=8355 RepID=A0A974DHP7_XENLA|nr:hypothetical protein XELAEV_18015275mg [Xenopus laevis]
MFFSRETSHVFQTTLATMSILVIFLDLTSESFVKNHLHSSFIQRKLSGREKREMQREILSIMGLPGRPRPASGGQVPSSAPLFMLDLYHAMCSEEDEDGMPGVSRAHFTTLSTQSPPLGTVISEADTVMSFVNMAICVIANPPRSCQDCQKYPTALFTFPVVTVKIQDAEHMAAASLHDDVITEGFLLDPDYLPGGSSWLPDRSPLPEGSGGGGCIVYTRDLHLLIPLLLLLSRLKVWRSDLQKDPLSGKLQKVTEIAGLLEEAPKIIEEPENGILEHDRDIFQQKPYWKEFKFDMTQIPTGESVTVAEFRLFKTRSFLRNLNRTLHISLYEIKKERGYREPELTLLDHESTLAGDEGWLVFDVTAASNHWLLNSKNNLGIRLYVETDQGQSIDPGIAGILGRRAPRSKQPFMVTFFRVSRNQIRSARAVKQLRKKQQKKHDLPHPNKLPGILDHVNVIDSRQVCKRHELYVSFRDLGWLDWVIAPQGYSAFYCEGECSFPLDSCMNATNHAILQSLVHLMKPESVPKACCAPTKLSATSVLYYDNNNNVILKKHRNMVVKSCGCH